MLKKNIFLLNVIGLVLINVTSGLSQSSSQPFSSSYEVQKIPANPDVAQLGRFGDIPVNKYNGTANISIPIYEIDFDGLKIPLALKYNTGGVRVEQEASWVGLGWSLSDGMTITRDVNGYEDIYNYDHLTAESIGWIYSKDYMKPVYPDDLVSGLLSEQDLIDLQTRSVDNKRPADTEPDFFSVSLPSGSCKFTLSKIVGEETILGGVVSDNMNFKVLYDRLNYTFKITDPNGFVYDFTVTENSTGYGSYESNDNYTKHGVVAGIRFPIFNGRHMISSWRVSKITSPHGRELDFTYEDGFYFSYPHFSESFDILVNNYPNFQAQRNWNVGNQPMSANMTAFHVKNLSMISGDFGSVDFVLTDRSDLVSKEDKLALSAFNPANMWNTYLIYGDALIAKKVEQVVVRNKANEIIKSANLLYSYFNSQWLNHEPVWDHTNPNDPEQQDPFACDVSYIRLKLDGVEIGDQKYEFEYHQPNSLPAKYSSSVDFWGFYNGITNATRIPSFNRFYVNHPGISGDDEWHEYFTKITGGNRNADINYGKIGNLQRITYPTGGYTLLDYEGHKVSMSNVNYAPKEYLSSIPSQLRFTTLDSSSNYKYSYQYMKLAKTPSYSLYDLNTCAVSSVIFQTNTNFEITETSFCNTQSYNVRIQGGISCSVGFGNGGPPSGKAIWIVNINTSQEYILLSHSNQQTSTLDITMNLPVGTYQLRTTNWTQSAPLPTVVFLASGSITKYFSEPIAPLVSEEFEVGGSRIKSVFNYDSDGSFISKSNYLYDQYVTENGKQVSNGKLMDELIFHSKVQNLFDYSAMDFIQNTSGCGPVLTSDNKLRTNPSAAGSHIGYSLVREEKVDVQENRLGQTVTEFSNKPNEYIFKHDEWLPRMTLGGLSSDNDFHTQIWDLHDLGIQYYEVIYGSVYILGARPIIHDYLNGSVLSEKIYNQSNSLIRETTNVYNTFQLWANHGGVGASALESAIVYYMSNSIIHFQAYRKIQFAERKLDVINQLVTTTTTEYQNDIQLSTITNNYFENPEHLLMTRSSTTGSDGNLYTIKYSYPKDLPTVPFMNDLVAENQVTSPIVMERYKGNVANPYSSLLEKVQTFYSNTNSITGDVLPREVYTYNLGNVTGQQRVLYEKYSNYGTLIQYRKSNEDIPNTLLWGYSKLFPIAQVVKAQSDQVAFTSFEENSTDGGWDTGGTTSPESKTGTKCLNAGNTISKNSLPIGNYVVGFWAKIISGSSGTVTINSTPIAITDTAWKYYEVTKNAISSVSVSNSNVYIDELRLHPVGAQMTSYTYKPLVGMTSQTDPNGNVTLFEYDAFGKLILIKDNEGNIVKKYSYNFKASAE